MYPHGMVSGPVPLPHLPGVDHAVDQVERLNDFKAAHPEWRIMFDKDYKVWRAWRLLDGGEDNVTRYGLRELLNALETR